MEVERSAAVGEDDMKGELLVLGISFAGLIYFVWVHLVDELPPDFLRKAKDKKK